VSHGRIYKSRFGQSSGVLKKELQSCLRTQRQFRQSRTNKAKALCSIIDAVSIADRPSEFEDCVPDHWEGDLSSGSASTHIGTLVV
jgi:IS30 family transposase